MGISLLHREGKTNRQGDAIVDSSNASKRA